MHAAHEHDVHDNRCCLFVYFVYMRFTAKSLFCLTTGNMSENEMTSSSSKEKLKKKMAVKIESV